MIKDFCIEYDEKHDEGMWDNGRMVMRSWVMRFQALGHFSVAAKAQFHGQWDQPLLSLEE